MFPVANWTEGFECAVSDMMTAPTAPASILAFNPSHFLFFTELLEVLTAIQEMSVVVSIRTVCFHPFSFSSRWFG